MNAPSTNDRFLRHPLAPAPGARQPGCPQPDPARAAADLLSDCAAVVFDCDGVLADSEPLAVSTWAALLAPYGYRPSADDISAALGRSFPDTRDIYAAQVMALPVALELLPRFHAIFLDRIEHDLHALDDGVRLARTLAASGTPIAVASSSPRLRLDAILRGVGLGGLFAVSVAGDEVGRGKPAPDPYLQAAAKLGVDPRDCVAIEDSTAGVASAAAAGMRTIGVRRDPVTDLRAADVAVESLILNCQNLPGRTP